MINIKEEAAIEATQHRVPPFLFPQHTNMKKIIVTACLLGTGLAGLAQIPDDVLRYSWQPVNGTARINAVGGAMGSLGGDISATFTNPAGLAMYKTGDFVISPGYSFLNNKGKFRGGNATDSDKYFNLGASGYVGAVEGSRSSQSRAFSIAVTRSANFSNSAFYRGQNDFSSYGEQYAAEAAGSGLSLDDILNSNNVSLGTRMAVYSYLIDTATIGANTNPDVLSMAMYNQLANGGDFLVNQANRIETSGGITEPAIGYAANSNDKFYIGGSVGIPIVKYNKNTYFREEDATGDNDNDFAFSELRETFSTRGIGVNVKLGVISRPTEKIRLGLAIHSPTWYSLEDSYDADMSVNLENYRSTPGTVSVNSKVFTNGTTPRYKYELTTPWKFMLSGTYIFNEVEDIRQQKGFITADIEYQTHKSNRFRNAEDYDDGGYYDQLNDVMKGYYKNAFNFRLGGELKFTTFMTRLGFAYYGNPYNDSELDASRMFISGGVGYRNAGIFIDLTYVHGISKDVSFPYRLPDKANTFANTTSNGSNVMLTLGFKI